MSFKSFFSVLQDSVECLRLHWKSQNWFMLFADLGDGGGLSYNLEFWWRCEICALGVFRGVNWAKVRSAGLLVSSLWFLLVSGPFVLFLLSWSFRGRIGCDSLLLLWFLFSCFSHLRSAAICLKFSKAVNLSALSLTSSMLCMLIQPSSSLNLLPSDLLSFNLDLND